ncbi:MAG: ABC transporter permease [Nitrospirota bacterium]
MFKSGLKGLTEVPLSVFGRTAFRSLYRNKMRSTLSVIGIAVGIAAVVCVVAIGSAGSKQAEQQLQNLGDNLIWIEAGSRNVNGVRSGSHGMTSLNMEDVEAIRSQIPLIKSVSPNADGSVGIIAGDKNWTTHYRGVTPEYFGIKRWDVAEGAPFTDQDVMHSANVCLLGQTAKEELFGPDEAVGRHVRINQMVFTVVGVLSVKGQTTTGQDQDDAVIMPYTTVLRKLRGQGFTWLDDIFCSALSRDDAEPAIERITALLRQRHHLQPGQPDDFNIRHPDETIKALLAAKQTLEMFLISVASIALLVGGIGIMNVMLATVAERTREIGIRLSIGATSRDIQIQFLAEAVMLGLFGGLIGVLAGVAGSYILGYSFGWSMSIPPEAVIAAPLFAIGVGVSSGFYPAWKASQLDPITALRLE